MPAQLMKIAGSSWWVGAIFFAPHVLGDSPANAPGSNVSVPPSANLSDLLGQKDPVRRLREIAPLVQGLRPDEISGALRKTEAPMGLAGIILSRSCRRAGWKSTSRRHCDRTTRSKAVRRVGPFISTGKRVPKNGPSRSAIRRSANRRSLRCSSSLSAPSCLDLRTRTSS